MAADAVGGENVYGISMPSMYSSDGSKDDAADLARNIGAHYDIQPIEPLFVSFQNQLELEGVAAENLQARIRGVMDERYKLLEYRTEHIKLTQLFDLKNDPWEQYNLFEMLGSDEIVARMREKLFEMRDEWEDESVLFGQQYWQQWRPRSTASPRPRAWIWRRRSIAGARTNKKSMLQQTGRRSMQRGDLSESLYSRRWRRHKNRNATF